MHTVSELIKYQSDKIFGRYKIALRQPICLHDDNTMAVDDMYIVLTSTKDIYRNTNQIRIHLCEIDAMFVNSEICSI